VRDIVRIPEASNPDKSSSLQLGFLASGNREWMQQVLLQFWPAVVADASLNSESELMGDPFLDHVCLSEKRGSAGSFCRFAMPAEVAW
jgi:hypothetical protein